MPVKNSTLANPDPIIMTPKEVNDDLFEYLSIKGFKIRSSASPSEIDIRAVKK
ncbi:hypothetical protein [Heyndrickxia acidicola]|uniref:Uncharacterized protein n=1 Tax=Heyndrickxia acidicola TaxID=209389 RepID=A0ABU6MHP6_9BACI|nr:hypothetical protein [Heyndrickxia acidicola]MED1204205.1 hypothetical protein [Heyndrickxia acidicola]